MPAARSRRSRFSMPARAISRRAGRHDRPAGVHGDGPGDPQRQLGGLDRAHGPDQFDERHQRRHGLHAVESAGGHHLGPDQWYHGDGHRHRERQGAVTGINLTNGGSGYVAGSSSTVTIAPPAATATPTLNSLGAISARSMSPGAAPATCPRRRSRSPAAAIPPSRRRLSPCSPMAPGHRHLGHRYLAAHRQRCPVHRHHQRRNGLHHAALGHVLAPGGDGQHDGNGHRGGVQWRGHRDQYHESRLGLHHGASISFGGPGTAKARC